jgi:hypothetical protein
VLAGSRPGSGDSIDVRRAQVANQPTKRFLSSRPALRAGYCLGDRARIPDPLLAISCSSLVDPAVETCLHVGAAIRGRLVLRRSDGLTREPGAWRARLSRVVS